MNDLMINLIMSVTVKQLNQMMRNSGIDIKTEKPVSVVRTKLITMNKIKVEFSYKTPQDEYYISSVFITVEENRLNLSF